VAVQVNPDQLMSFGGSTEPCAVCIFGNIGSINNKDFAKQVSDKISKDLNIASNRCGIFYISYLILYYILHTADIYVLFSLSQPTFSDADVSFYWEDVQDD